MASRESPPIYENIGKDERENTYFYKSVTYYTGLQH